MAARDCDTRVDTVGRLGVGVGAAPEGEPVGVKVPPHSPPTPPPPPPPPIIDVGVPGKGVEVPLPPPPTPEEALPEREGRGEPLVGGLPEGLPDGKGELEEEGGVGVVDGVGNLGVPLVVPVKVGPRAGESVGKGGEGVGVLDALDEPPVAVPVGAPWVAVGKRGVGVDPSPNPPPLVPEGVKVGVGVGVEPPPPPSPA